MGQKVLCTNRRRWGRNTIEIQCSSTSCSSTGSSSTISSSISFILLNTIAISYSFTLSVIFHITFFCLNSCTFIFIGNFNLGISDSFTDIFSYCKGKGNLLRGSDNCLGTAQFVVQVRKIALYNTGSVRNFLYFNTKP